MAEQSNPRGGGFRAFSQHAKSVSISSTIDPFLKDMNWPARKQDLIKHAKDMHAPEQVVQVLEKLPGQEFKSPDEVDQAATQLQQ